MTTEEEKEVANPGEIDYLDADNIRIKNTALFEHFISIDVASQISLLSSVQGIYEEMEAHLTTKMEKTRQELEEFYNMLRLLKEN